MAKKARKTKITETIVNQLQETPVVEEEVKEEVKIEERKEKGEHKEKPVPQKSKLFDKIKESQVDSETSGINFGISGVL